MNENTKPDETALSLLKGCPVIRIIGVGGAGGNMVDELAADPMPGASCLAVDTDLQALSRRSRAATLVLGADVTRGLSAGGDPKIGRAAAEADEEQLQQWCEGADLVFLLAGLGGGTSSGASPVAARAAKTAGALVLGLAAMPFEFEGSRRQRQAILGLARLRQEADAVVCVPNQQVFHACEASRPAAEVLAAANRSLAGAVRGLWRLLARPGLVNLDFGSLRAALAGHHSESWLAAAEAAGDTRAFEVWERLSHCPAFQAGRALAEAESVLVSFAGGPDLAMMEIEWIMSQIKELAGNASLLFGCAVDESLAGRLEVTLLASRFGEMPAESSASASDSATEPVAAPTEVANRLTDQNTIRPRSRCVPPPPEVSQEKARQLYRRQAGRNRRKRDNSMQAMLPLEVFSKGRFENTVPTIHNGQDLDYPTYLRWGITLKTN